MRRFILCALMLALAVPAAAQKPVEITPSPYCNGAGACRGSVTFPASSSLLFGASADYGIKDNAGTMQVKNAAGSWADIPASAASAGGWTDTGTVVQLSTGTDTLYVQSAGPHAIGSSALGYTRLYLAGNLTSDGGSDQAYMIRSSGTLTGASGDTTLLAGQTWINAITTQASDAVAVVTQAYFGEPNITVGAGGSVPVATTVYIKDAPTEGTLNYSLLNDSTTLSRFDGPIAIGSTGKSSKLTTGLSLYQGAADDEILSLASSDVAHGMTDVADTDVYALAQKFSATGGGVSIRGLTEAAIAVGIRGYVTTENSTKSSSGTGVINLDGLLKSGTNVGSMSANANLVAIRNISSTVWLADTDGDTWQAGIVTSTSHIFATGNPATEGGVRINCTGTTPSRTCSVLIYDGGAVRTIATSAAF